jgi:O-antigen/teichoic acid export membrane protein
MSRRRFQPWSPRGLSAAAQSLAKGFSLVMAARLAGAGVGLASQVVMARLLGADALGRVYVALSLAGVLAIGCGLGFPAVATRFIAQYRAERNWAALAAFVAVARRYTLAATCLIVAAVAAGIVLLPTIGPDARDVLLLGLLTTPAFVALRLNGAIANAYRRFGLAYVPDFLGRPALFLLASGVLFAGLMAPTAQVFLMLHLIGCAAVVLPQRWLVSGLIDREPAASPTPSRPPPQGSTWLAHALPMIVVALFTGLFADVDVLLISPFLTTEQVAVFAVCLKLALLTGFAVQLVQQIVLPDTADAYARGDTRSVRAHIRRANLLSTAISVVAAMMVAGAGGLILGTFGHEFVEGHACLIVLAVSQVVRAAAGPAAYVLTFAGAERSSIVVCVVSLGVLALANATLAPTFGLLGAAAAVMITTALWSVWLAALARQHAGVDTTLLRMVA